MRLRRFLAPLAALTLVTLFSGTFASADILISIDKSAQQMTVTVDGQPLYVWPVSTGAPGYDTPNGEFKPFRMERDHFSREWDDAPMPHSIFFTQEGHAIHGSYHVKNLGRPASHGCVRLEPGNAGILFALVRQQKMANTRVVLSGETPTKAGVPVARRDQGIMADEDFTASLPAKRQRQVRDWRDTQDDQRTYYRERPTYYAPRRFYRYGGSPYPYGW
jgi:hypothetical protein